MVNKRKPGRKRINLLPEQKLALKKYIEEALVGGLPIEKMLTGAAELFTAKGWPNPPSINTIKAFLKPIKAQLQKAWDEVLQDPIASRQVLHLRLEAMYAAAMPSDPKVAHAIWKDMYLMTQPKRSPGRPKEDQEEAGSIEDLFDEDELELMDDEALEEAIENGIKSGELPLKVADHLIGKDHDGK